MANSHPRPRPAGLWQWHLWAGLLVLLTLLLAAVSGSLLVYQKELVRTVVTPGASLPPGYGAHHLASQLQRLVAAQPPGTTVKLKAPSADEPYWTVRNDHTLTLLDIGSLEPYRDRTGLLRVLAIVRELHVDLMSAAWGEAVLLASGILGLFLVVSGVLLWWPGRRAFRWRWVLPRTIRPSQYLQYHRHTGALFSPLLILVVLTGSIMLWQKRVQPLLPPLSVETIQPSGALPESMTVAQAYQRAQRAVADGWPTYISAWSDGEGQHLKVRFRLPGEWHLNGRTTVWITRNDGAVKRSERSDESGPARRLLNQLYPLHSGYGMNSLYRLLALLTGLALVWSVWTGSMHYCKRWRRRRRSHYK